MYQVMGLGDCNKGCGFHGSLGSLRSGHGRETVMTSWMSGVATLRSWVVAGLGHEMVTTSWKVSEVWGRYAPVMAAKQKN